MTKISNRATYTNESPISENDFIIGTNGDSPALETKTFNFGKIRTFVNAGLEPVTGGTLAVTEVLYTGILTSPQDVVNQLVPNKTIMPYEVFLIGVNGTRYITAVQDRTVGDTQPPTNANDYFALSDGSETKILVGTNLTLSGNGTIPTPYIVASPDSTSSVRGVLKLTGDLGGTADSPTTPTAIHTTGNEIKTGTLTVNSIIKAGGTASEFLKANGSTDSSVYALDSTTIHTTGNEIKTGTLTVTSIIKSGGTSSQFLMANGTVTTKADTLYQFQVIEMDVTAAYITANFDGTGLGINLMVGMAICNGQNGTKNRNGKVPLQYDPTNYPNIGTSGGEKEHLLTVPEMPSHSHPFSFSAAGEAGGGFIVTGDDVIEGGGAFGMTDTGGGLPHNNMQPYIITLFVQKL